MACRAQSQLPDVIAARWAVSGGPTRLAVTGCGPPTPRSRAPSAALPAEPLYQPNNVPRPTLLSLLCACHQQLCSPGKHAFRAIDHHWDRPQFATAGAAVEIWDHERSEPVHSFSWGADTITSGAERGGAERPTQHARASACSPSTCAPALLLGLLHTTLARRPKSTRSLPSPTSTDKCA